VGKTATKSEAELFAPAETEEQAKAGKPSRAVAKRSDTEKGRFEKLEPTKVIPVSGLSEILGTFERLAVNPNVNPDTLNKLLDVQERLLAKNAEQEFNRSFVEMQPHLPIITKDGRIVVREKDKDGKRTGEIIQDTGYAKWETVLPLIKPILADHGFGINHRVTTHDPATRRVTAILRHIGGHVDDSCYFDVTIDTSGSKNNIQGWASSVSYGKRHSAFAVLTIATKDEDDDGQKSGRAMVDGEPLTAHEMEQVIELAGAVECGKEHLLKHLNKTRPKRHQELKRLEDLPRSRFDDAIAALNSYESNKRAREAEAKAARK